MKNLFLITIFALIMSGANAQDKIILNNNTTVQQTEAGASIQLETSQDKAIKLLVDQMKARKDNTITTTKQGQTFNYYIYYQQSIYVVIDQDDTELMQSTRIADVKTYFKILLKE